MVKRVGVAMAVGVVVAVAGVVGWTSLQGTPEPTQPPVESVGAIGAPARPRPNPSPEPTVGDPAPVVDPAMDEAKVGAFLRISGEVGATHQRVAEVVADSEFTIQQRVFVHTSVQDYLDSIATYRDQVAAGEMQERDLVFNDEEARDTLDDTLRQRLQGDADRILDVL